MKNMKTLIMLLLSFALVFPAAAVSGGAASAEAEATASYQEWSGERLQQSIEQVAQHVIDSGELSEWGAIGLYRSGQIVPPNYIRSIEERLNQADGQLSRITDYQRLTLGILAAGGDPMNIAGFNLVDRIFTEPDLARQGANGVIFALLVLNSGNIELTDSHVWTEQALLDWMLEAQNDDGGWSLASGQRSSVDITSMALTALAPFSEQSGVQASIDRAIEYLSQVQRSDGSFPGLSSEATAQVIIALTSLGVDPEEERFTKPSGTPVTYLMSMQREDGGFAHLPDGDTDPMATEQALLALVSLQLFHEGEPGLYAGLKTVPASVYIEGPAAAIASGSVRAVNALEAAERLLVNQEIPYAKEVFPFGSLITAIDGIEQGSYGGYDGWYYAVKRNGKWIYPEVSIDSFELEANDEVWLYYSDYTLLLKEIKILPQEPKSDETIEVYVTVSEWDWNVNEEVYQPAANVTVSIGGQQALTNESGIATFGPLPSGEYIVEVNGYQEATAPTVVRGVADLYVRPSSLAEFTDATSVSGWAIEEVAEAIERGLMQGTRRDQPTFAPQRMMTRAEFATLLANTLQLDQSTPYLGALNDVAKDSWYSGAVAVLSEQEIIEQQGEFRPSEPITREEMAIWTARALGLQSTKPIQFKDEASAAKDAVPYMMAAAEQGIIVGHNEYFRPKDAVTREAAAAVAVRIVNFLEKNNSAFIID